MARRGFPGCIFGGDRIAPTMDSERASTIPAANSARACILASGSSIIQLAGYGRGARRWSGRPVLSPTATSARAASSPLRVTHCGAKTLRGLSPSCIQLAIPLAFLFARALRGIRSPMRSSSRAVHRLGERLRGIYGLIFAARPMGRGRRRIRGRRNPRTRRAADRMEERPGRGSRFSLDDRRRRGTVAAGGLGGFETGRRIFRRSDRQRGRVFRADLSPRRAALVLWPSETLTSALAGADVPDALAYLESRVERAGSDEDRERAKALADAIAARLVGAGWFSYSAHQTGPAARLLEALRRLGHVAGIEAVVERVLPARGVASRDAAMVFEALSQAPEKRRVPLVERLVTGAAAECFAACAKLLRLLAQTAEAQQLRKAATLLLAETPPGQTVDPAWRARRTHPEEIADLLAALRRIDAVATAQAVATCSRRPRHSASTKFSFRSCACSPSKANSLRRGRPSRSFAPPRWRIFATARRKI